MGNPLGVIHKSTGLLGSAQAIAAMIDDAEFDRAIMHRPAAILALDKAHRLADKRFAEIDLSAAPADGAAGSPVPCPYTGPNNINNAKSPAAARASSLAGPFGPSETVMDPM